MLTKTAGQNHLVAVWFVDGHDSDVTLGVGLEFLEEQTIALRKPGHWPCWIAATLHYDEVSLKALLASSSSARVLSSATSSNSFS